MDVAVFMRSRRRLWTWLVLPAALTVVVHVSIRAYVAHTARGFLRRQAMAASLPPMEEKLRAVRNGLRKFAFVSEGDIEPAELVKSRVARAAQQVGFAVNTLSIDRPAAGTPPPKGQIPYLLVHVAGEGPLASVIQLLNDVQSGGGLVAVDAATVRLIGLTEAPQYNGEFAFRYYMIEM